MLRKKRGLWIILIVLILAAAGGYYYYNTVYLPAQAPEEPTIQTTKVRRGDLVISATGAGTVIAASEIDLGFGTSGVLTELAVGVGDKVKAGDVLARIDDYDAQRAVSNAEIQVDKAKLDLEETERNHEELLEGPSEATKLEAQATVKSAKERLTELGEGPSEADLLQAQAAVATAEDNLSELQDGASEADIASAKATLATARETCQRLLDGPDEDEIEQKELALTKAKNSLWSAQMSRDAKGSQRDIESGAYDQAQANVLNAEISVWLAETDLEQLKEPATQAELEDAEAKVAHAQETLAELKDPPTQAELQDARAKVAQAQESLAELQEGASEAEIAEAEAQLAKASENLEDLLNNPSAEDIATSEAKVEQARLGLVQAELNLEAAEKDLEDTLLVTPMDGTVMVINAEVGESVGSGALLTLADLGQPVLEIYLDESDMGMMAVGHEVEIVFDALPDETFTGHVIRVDPALVTESGVQTIRGLVTLDGDSFAKPQGLPMGMNATVDVIGGRAQNAVLVPVEALRELDAGEYAVFVVEDGVPKLRMVEVGLMDYTYAEVRSGLDAGETVSTGIVETK